MSQAERLLGKGVGFERIRRITGYLVGSLDRFNNAKRQEVEDRVVHFRCGMLASGRKDSANPDKPSR